MATTYSSASLTQVPQSPRLEARGNEAIYAEFQTVYNALRGLALGASGPLLVAGYTLTTLPAAASYPGYIINVTDATGGPKIVMSNGTNWLILNTGTIVS